MLKKTGLFVVILSFLALLEPRSSQAQEIKVDGSTATIVTKDGDRITIDGNTFSRDGKNLFHSFKEFGLTQQQIATFLTNPNIHNILTRVTGGNPSYINGLIQVVGGNSNLFLMNPAGVVFGSGASINVPADFTATTATGIGFNNGVFSAVGSNDYTNLTGNPTNFVFNTNQPGSIINAGDLKVSEGSNINLIGGNVINTGTIETPNGKINIQAVAGTSRVKITPEGSLLSLELDIPKDEQGNLLGFTPQDLPTLITGANNAGVATPNVAVNNNQVQVANVNIPEGTGSSIVSGKVSTSSESLGGEITVLGERVGVIDAEISANGAQGGGKVLIGGDKEGKGTIPNAQVTYISPDSKISADATVNGDGGQVIVYAEEYANIHGELTAKGGSVSGDGGFIETSGKKSFNITSVPDTSAVNGQAGEWLIDPLNVTIVSGLGNIEPKEGETGTEFAPLEGDVNTVGVDRIKTGLTTNNTVTITTQGDVEETTEAGDILWQSANLDYDGIGANKTLRLEAFRNIIFEGSVINDSDLSSTTQDSLNVIFNSNVGGEGGAVRIVPFISTLSSIETNGGNIIIGGGADPFLSPAVGTSDLGEGVRINATLSAGGGDIIIRGQGSSTPQSIVTGVEIFGNAQISTIGEGNITIIGEGGSDPTNSGVIDFSRGIGINSDGIISAENGQIRLEGIGGSTSGSSNDGINWFSNGKISTSGTGAITLDGIGNNGSSGLTLALGSIETVNGNVNLSGNGGIITPNLEEGTFTINGGGITTLNSFITNAEGSIEPRDISLTGENDFNNLAITNGQNVTLNDINDINLGNLNVTGDFSLTSRGNITANQGLVLNSGNINLTALGNLSTPSNDINLTSSGSIDLSANQILTDGGNLSLNALGNINTPNINTGGSLADNGGNVNITSSTGNIQTGNIFTNNSSESLGDSGNVTLNASQGSLNVGDIDITNFSLADISSNAVIDLNALSTINTGAITLGHDNDNTLSTGNVTIETPSVVTVNGNIESNGSDIIIGTATPSEVNINGSVNSNGGNITINSTGLIKIDSGEDTNSIFSGSGNIILNHGGGDLEPRVPFTVGDANINGTSGSIITATESIEPLQTYSNSFATPNATIAINTTDAPIVDLPIVASTLDIDGDNTGSIVSSNDGLLIDITGGTFSENGNNLFHSFTRFDLPQSDQTANFITDRQGINNILARIISGEASLINGTIQVTGLSNPNLFLMNPAGIVFGSNAIINVPADFVATTATGIGFGDNWFSANGDYNASLLNVDPINLAFTANTSGAIINNSSLNNANGSVSLLGGTQINTDNLTNNNTLNLSAIQGQNILDLTTVSVTPASASASLPNEFIPPILTLEELVNTALAKGSGNLGITVLESNSLQVDSNETIVNLGDIATQNLSASNANIVATGNVTLGTFGDTIADNSNSLNVNANGQLQLLGTLEPKGGDVSIVGVNNFISPNNINTGGGNFTLSTSSDYSLDIALFTDGGNFTLNSLGDVAINSGITTTGGDIEVTGNNISSGDGVVLPFNTANDAGNGGNINLSSLNGNVNVNGLSSESSVGNGGNITVNANLGDINIGNVNTLSGGNLSLTATGNISNTEGLTVGGSTLLSAGGNINLDNSNNDFQTFSIQNANNVTLADVNDLTLANIDASGNSTPVAISGNLDLRVTGTTNINSNIQANNLITNGTTVIDADAIITTLDQTYNNSVILARDTQLDGNNITFGSSIDSQSAETPQSLTINGVSELGNVGNTNPLSQLTTQQTTLTGNIKTTGNQTYNDVVTLANDVQLDGNNIIFGSSIDSQSAETPQSLTINGVTTLNSVGNTNSLNNLTTTQQTTLTGDVKTTGNQTYNDAVTLANDVQLDGNNIIFGSSIDSQSAETPQSLTINGVSELGNVGSVNALSQLTTQQTTLTGNVKTTGNQTYNDAVTLANDVQLDGNNIIFGSSIDSQTTPQSLTVTANENINYGDGIGDDRIGGNVGLNNLESTALDIFLNIDRTALSPEQASIRTIGDQTYNITSNIGETLYLAKDTIIETNNFNLDGNIRIAPSAINGVSLTVNSSGGVSITTNNTAIDSINTALGSKGGNITIKAVGNIDIDGVINTAGLENNAFVLNAGNVSLNSIDGIVAVETIGTTGLVTSGSVNITGQNIAIGAIITDLSSFGSGGTVDLNALNTLVLGEIRAESLTVSGNLLLSNFKVLGLEIPPQIPFLASSNITTTQDQVYNGTVFTDDNVTFTGRNVSFNGGIDSYDLNINNNTDIENIPPSEIVNIILDSIQNRQNATPNDLIITASNNIQLGDGIGDDRIGSVAGLANLTTTGATNININTPSDGISINTTEAQVYNNSVTLESDTTLNSKNVTFNGTVTGNKNLKVNSNNNGITTFNSTVTGLNTLTTNADGTTILGGDVTTLGSQEYNDAVILNNDVTLTTSDSSIEFANTVNGNKNLKVETGSGNISFNNAIGNTQGLGNVELNSTGVTALNTVNSNSLKTNAGGTTELNGNVTTTATQTYNDAVTLNNDVTLTTTDSSIEFANTVNGNKNLKVETGSGNISFNNAIGNTQGLGDVELNSTGTTTLNTVNANSLKTNEGGTTQLNANVTTVASQEYNDAVTLNNDVTLTTTDSSIEFANTVNGNQNLTVETGSGDITFNNAIGNSQSLGDVSLNSSGTTSLNTVNANSLKTNEGGTTRLNGDVTTSGNQVYQDNLFLDSSTIITTNNLNAVSIEANQNSTTPISLTINANDSVTITGKPDTNSLLAISTARKNNQETGNITINAENNINLLGAVNTTATSGISFATTAGDISLTSTNGDVSALAIASIGTQTSGNVKISGNNVNTGVILTFLNPTNVTTGTVDIQGNTTKVSGTIQALSLKTSGTFTLAENPTILALPNANLASLGNARVTTINNQNYNNFNAINKTTLSSIQGEISFTGGVNGNDNNLTMSSLKGVNFGNQNFTSLGGNLIITTLNPSGEILIGNGNDSQFVITNLDRANGFNSITIGQNRNLGTITINENLTVNDPLTLQASNIFVNNAISGNDNASITLRGAKTTTTLNADIITQGNDIVIDDNVIVGNNVTLSTGGDTGNIDILGSINGNNNLTLNAGSSNILLADNVSVNDFSVTANNTQFTGNSIKTTGNQNFNSNLTLTKNTNFNSQGTFSSRNISSRATDVNIIAQDISTQNVVTQGGSISMISSDGAISTQNLNTSGTTGGSIELNSNTTINTGRIQTSGDNRGGDVTLNAPSNIVISSIDARSGNRGGDVDISTAGTLRVTETISSGVSIDTTGGSQGGSVTIDLFPGDLENGVISDPRLPFVVGDASKNGTAGIITNTNFSIGLDEYIINTTKGNLNLKLLSRVPVDPNNSVNVNNPVTTAVDTFAPPVIPIATITEAQEILSAIEREAAEKPAFIYVSFTPKGFQPRDLEEEFARREATNTQEYSRVNINKPNLQPTIALQPAEDDQLDLLVITNKGEPIRVTVPVTRQQVVDSALNLSIELSSDRLDEQYKPYATELYSWLIAPIEETLKEREISNLLFILPLNIRFAPLASLYDEKAEQFLVEKYSSGLAPSLNLNDNRYRSVKDLNLLAMGAAEFAEDQQQIPLPGVGLELPTIKKIWNEQAPDNYREFLNNNFTLENIKANLDKQPYGIIHFGTHGSFGADEEEDIFIQLYNSRLNFGDITQLGLSRSSVELMLLSACQTALGNEIAELGFAGLAVQAGVKSAIGTVWTIGDTGTLAFMTDFYSELRTQTTKAEALRQTQLNMLNGKVRKSDDGNTIITPNMSVSLEGLPEESRQREDFSHPFYWAPFTLIGNPW
ncbi:CHAT domain-containing protein [Geminocystis sp. CENA526]|uniref:two-partner secretion domain-containing protein n=1 Tax=Geminocystis sp. CENA526 TaxID=1355871 RepID=UPI003D6DEE8F